jgi:protein AaeX
VSYAEVNLFGVYVAPIAPMLVVAWLLLIPLRRLADRFGLLRHVWHPPLFLYCVYVMLLSAIVLLVGRIGR